MQTVSAHSKILKSFPTGPKFNLTNQNSGPDFSKKGKILLMFISFFLNGPGTGISQIFLNCMVPNSNRPNFDKWCQIFVYSCTKGAKLSSQIILLNRTEKLETSNDHMILLQSGLEFSSAQVCLGGKQPAWSRHDGRIYLTGLSR